MSRLAQQAIYIIVTVLILIGSYVTYYSYIAPPTKYSLEPTDGVSINYQMSSCTWIDAVCHIEYKWDVEGIKAVYFNGNGVIGQDSRLKAFDRFSPQSYDLRVELNNGESVTLILTAKPTSVIHFIIILWGLLSLAILVWLKLFYDFDVVYNLAIIFLFVFAVMLTILGMPNYLPNNHLLERLYIQPINLIVQIATVIFSFSAFLIILIKPQFAKHIAERVRSKIHPILLVLILLVWGGILYWVGIKWYENSELFVYYYLSIYLVLLGVFMIYLGRLANWYLIICTIASTALLFIAVISVDGRTLNYDARQNQSIAYNLAKYQVYSHNVDDTPQVKPSMFREPVYPFYLAAHLYFFTNPDTLNLECIQTLRCPSTQIVINLASVPIYILLVWVFTAVAHQIIRNWWIVVGLIIILFSVDYFVYNVAKTELPAALFLLLHSFFLYKVFLEHESKRRAYQYAIISGISLGLLILTKAIFLYWMIVLGIILILSYLIKLSSSIQYRSYILLFLVVNSVISPWMLRNYLTFGELQVAERGSDILAIRAEYSFITWDEYVASFAIFASNLLHPYVLPLFDPDDYYHLDRRVNNQNIDDAYERRANLRIGTVAQLALEQFGSISDDDIASTSISILRENWIQHIALTFTFAWRGSMFHFDPDEVRHRQNLVQTHDAIQSQMYSDFTALLALLMSFTAIPSMLVVAVHSLKKRNWALLLFLLSALYSFGIHAAMTHYIPRYSVPILPFLLITIGLVFQSILQYIQRYSSQHVNSTNLD